MECLLEQTIWLRRSEDNDQSGFLNSLRRTEARFCPKFLNKGSRICRLPLHTDALMIDRKSTRLNSSHQIISYAVFCLKKKIRPARPMPLSQPGPLPDS